MPAHLLSAAHLCCWRKCCLNVLFHAWYKGLPKFLQSLCLILWQRLLFIVLNPQSRFYLSSAGVLVPKHSFLLLPGIESESESISHSVVPRSLWLYGLGPTNLLCLWNLPGKNTGVGSHSLLQGISPTQGSNLSILYCRQILYRLSHQGSPLQYAHQPKNLVYIYHRSFDFLYPFPIPTDLPLW